jgi:tight adherence protein B
MMLAIALFVGVFLLTAGSAILALKFLRSRTRKQVAGMIETVEQKDVLPTPVILKDLDEEAGRMNALLKHDRALKLDAWIQQAGTGGSLRQLAMNVGSFAVVGAFVGALIPVDLPLLPRILCCACLLGALPVFSVARKRAKRLKECEEQLPEALDFLARSMRAGHAFIISLEMLAQETPDPLGLEFRTLFNEQNLGASLETALRNLTDRVPLLDMRFFCSAVTLQRQTGGNLGEILTRLSWVIRERFRLRGQVRAASSHGRMTAGILCALPLFTMFGMLVVAPGYLQGMAADPDGRMLIVGSVVGQIVGNIVIRKIINIEV